MDLALDLGDRAADALGAVELHTLGRQQLATAVVRVQGIIDRFTLAHAQMVAEADRMGVWQGTGARSMADWLAGKTNTSYGSASGLLALGETADASPEVAAAVGAGEMSAATAATLHDAITTAPAGADVSSLVKAVKGTGPRSSGRGQPVEGTQLGQAGDRGRA